jgi:hypothetical protein
MLFFFCSLLVAAACSSGGASDEAGGLPTVVQVKLGEYSIIPDSDPVRAGRVVLEVRNSGPQKRHELVIVRGDAPPDGLPLTKDGAAELDGIEVVARVDAQEIGGAAPVDLTMEPGRYIMLCNLVDRAADGSLEAHYSLRMHSVLTVVPAPPSGTPGALTPAAP